MFKKKLHTCCSFKLFWFSEVKWLSGKCVVNSGYQDLAYSVDNEQEDKNTFKEDSKTQIKGSPRTQSKIINHIITGGWFNHLLHINS